MATKQPKRKPMSAAAKAKMGASTGFGVVREEDLATFGSREMGIYADEVNLARAIPDLVDGLIPVQRRIMWAAYQMPNEFVKTARVSGETMGRYHPHGDASIEGAIVTMVQANVPLLRGKGNWGSLVDRAAASRYTNLMIGAYGRTMFDPNYIHKSVTSFGPNYDATTVEPVSLPSIFPHILTAAAQGIGVGKGKTTMFPSFSPESVVDVCTALLKGERLQAADFARRLKYFNRNGGQVVKTKANAVAWFQMFKTSQAKVQFQCRLEIDRDAKIIEIDDWPQDMDPKKILLKIRELPEVEHAAGGKGATRIRIEMGRGYNYAQFDTLVGKVQKICTKSISFKVNATHRTSRVEAGTVRFDTEFLSLSIPELIVTWLKERLHLEKRSLEHRIVKQNEAIAYSKLMIWVHGNSEAIVKIIKTHKEPKAALKQQFKLSDLQVQQIWELQLGRISRIDQGKVKETLEQQIKFLAQLQAWLAKPKPKVASDLQNALVAIQADLKFEAEKKRKMKVT